jgi:hypothetical protein
MGKTRDLYSSMWQPGKSPTDDPPCKMMHTAYSAQVSHVDSSSQPKLSFFLTAVKETFWLDQPASHHPYHLASEPRFGVYLQTSQACSEPISPSPLIPVPILEARNAGARDTIAIKQWEDMIQLLLRRVQRFNC